MFSTWLYDFLGLEILKIFMSLVLREELRLDLYNFMFEKKEGNSGSTFWSSRLFNNIVLPLHT